MVDFKKHLDHIHKIFNSFEHIVSSDRSWFTLLKLLYWFGHLSIWNNLFSKRCFFMVWFLLYWTMPLYGVIFTWALSHKALLEKQPLHQWQLKFSQNVKLCKEAYIWKWLFSFLNQRHCLVNGLVSLHHKFFQAGKVEYSSLKH